MIVGIVVVALLLMVGGTEPVEASPAGFRATAVRMDFTGGYRLDAPGPTTGRTAGLVETRFEHTSSAPNSEVRTVPPNGPAGMHRLQPRSDGQRRTQRRDRESYRRRAVASRRKPTVENGPRLPVVVEDFPLWAVKAFAAAQK